MSELTMIKLKANIAGIRYQQINQQPQSYPSTNAKPNEKATEQGGKWSLLPRIYIASRRLHLKNAYTLLGAAIIVVFVLTYFAQSGHMHSDSAPHSSVLLQGGRYAYDYSSDPVAQIISDASNEMRYASSFSPHTTAATSSASSPSSSMSQTCAREVLDFIHIHKDQIPYTTSASLPPSSGSSSSIPLLITHNGHHDHSTSQNRAVHAYLSSVMRLFFSFPSTVLKSMVSTLKSWLRIA